MSSRNSHHKVVIAGGGTAGISVAARCSRGRPFPLIDREKERYDMWLLKRYGLPFLSGNLMLKDRA